MLKRKSDGREHKHTSHSPMQAAEITPMLNETLEQSVKPVLNEAQQIAATTSVSGRKAVSRGAIILAFYFWLLSGAILFSWIARHTQFFPGDRRITRTLQKYKNSESHKQIEIKSEQT